MKASLRSIIQRFVKLSRSSVDQEITDATAARLASLARASQPRKEELSRNRVVRGLGFLGTIGVAGWVATGVAAAVTVSTLVATNNMPKPIQSFSADVLEIVGIDAPRPVKARLDTKPEEKPDTKPEEIPPVVTPEPTPPIENMSRLKAFAGVDSASTALSKLESLTVVEYDYSCTDTYDRDEWKHWSSVGPEDGEPPGTNLNTRHNELRKESLTAVTYSDSNRSVINGLWDLVYVEGTTTEPSDLDAEHVLPLANMHVRACSAGIVLTESEKKVLANDPVLVFVTDDGANQSRGARSWATSPYGDGWFPPNTSIHCDWLQIQIQLLDKYSLPVSAEEVSVATTRLSNC